MPETQVLGKTNQISETKPLTVDVDGRRFGIYRLKGKYYAYENNCAHEGGPAVEGELIGHNVCDFDPSTGKKLGERFSSDKFDIVCPWHGVQYDLETGVCTADARLQLTRAEVIIDGENIKLRF